MSRKDTFSATRFINLYSNRVLEKRIQKDLKTSFDSAKEAVTYTSPEITGKSPIILLGMHRSGTTLTSQLLRSAGIEMGALRGSDTDESLFFQNVNRALFNLAGSKWDKPEHLQKFLEDKVQLDKMTLITETYCRNRIKTKPYFGLKVWRDTTFFNMKIPWGWKDPRTCFTLPIWLKIFPGAKIIYIQRNGVDVANSLVTRNKTFINHPMYSEQTKDLKGAYLLWEAYNQECLNQLAGLPEEQVLSIRYEDLLNTPEDILKSIFDFLEHDMPSKELQSLTSQIRKSRGYAFAKNDELRAFYSKVKDDELMVRMRYNQIDDDN